MVVLSACNSPPKAVESEAPLAVEDSAHAHLGRIEQAMEKGDSAAYMAAYPEGVVMAFDGQLFNDRTEYAKAVGEQVRSGKIKDVSMSNEEILVVGPRAAAVTINFSLETADSAGKPSTTRGSWSGVLGVRDGRTVILQQHMSHMPAQRQ